VPEAIGPRGLSRRFGVAVFGFLAMTPEHCVRLIDQPLGLGDALPQFELGGFDFGRLALAARGAIFGCRHLCVTNLTQIRSCGVSYFTVKISASVK